MFKTLFYIPIYNALVFIIDILPGHSAGWAVVLLTILIRFVLYPLAKKSIKTQILMKRIEPEAKRIRENVADKQDQARQLMKLYKDNDINPFAGLFLLILQFPILIGLYNVFRSGLPKIDVSILYSFVQEPTIVVMTFLGTDLLQRSFILALIAVITQFIQINLALPKQPPTAPNPNKKPSFQDDFAKSMNTQMRYIFPLIIFPIAYISSVISLYFITSNIFMSIQEVYIRRRLEKGIK
ncbi:MAG: YidC/Oxa1 family membrane protein insertase [Patescibacteria group bacterium]